MSRKAIAWSLFALSTLGGLFIVYHLLFAIWMTAHPLYDSQVWRNRVYERFGCTVLDALIWGGSILWLWRMAKNHQSSEYPTTRQQGLFHGLNLIMKSCFDGKFKDEKHRVDRADLHRLRRAWALFDGASRHAVRCDELATLSHLGARAWIIHNCVAHPCMY